MEFKEYSNPEEKDYDINSDLDSANTSNYIKNQYVEQLIDLIGILEDISDEELEESYGISMVEYLNPNENTITKVKQKLNNTDVKKCR